MLFFFFFFQAEDGIRDGTVTGVQTCALPISPLREACLSTSAPGQGRSARWHPAVRVSAPLETETWPHRSLQFADKPPPDSLCTRYRADAAGGLPEPRGRLPGRLRSA